MILLVCLGKLHKKDLTQNTVVSTRSGGIKLQQKDIALDYADVEDNGDDSDGKLQIKQKLIYMYMWLK